MSKRIRKRESSEVRAARWQRYKVTLRANPVAFERRRRMNKEWFRANKEVLQERRRRKEYGLTPEAYMALMVEQQGCCAICKQARPLKVDHDHKTGAVRGLLCNHCNHAVGQLFDDPELFLVARNYLIRWSSVVIASPQLSLLAEDAS